MSMDPLVERARGGDPAALEALLRDVAPAIHRFGLRMCRNAADAEDVLQDALLGAVRGFTQFRGEAAFRTWLFSILRHACFREQRRGAAAAGSASRSMPGAEPEDASAVAADVPGPERQASSRQLAAAVVQAIEELEPTQREALVLRDIEGLSAVEVAELTGSSVDAVKSRLHRARRTVQLRAALLAEPLLAEPLRPAAASSCPDILQLYSERLEGDVSPDLCERLQEHVDHCPACQATCDSLKRTLQLCSTVPVGPVPDHIQQAVQHALRPTSAPL